MTNSRRSSFRRAFSRRAVRAQRHRSNRVSVPWAMSFELALDRRLKTGSRKLVIEFSRPWGPVTCSTFFDAGHIFLSRADGLGSRTIQQGVAGGGRGKLAMAREHCECEPERPRPTTPSRSGEAHARRQCNLLSAAFFQNCDSNYLSIFLGMYFHRASGLGGWRNDRGPTTIRLE